MSKLTGKINQQLQGFGFQIKKYKPENYIWLSNLEIKTIIDVGANTGQFAKKFSKILPKSKIYSFEPIKKCYEALVKNTEGLNVESFNLALGNMSGEIEMNVSTFSPSSSILEMNKIHEDLYPHTKGSKNEVIKIQRLDDILPFNTLEKNIFLKIDVQGFEDKVLKGAIDNLKFVKVILIEMSYVELYKGQPLFDDIYHILSELGFAFKGNIEQTVNQFDGSPIYSDSIFIKT